MRIEGPSRNTSNIRRGKAADNGSGVFRADGDAAQTPRAASAAPSAPTTGIEALIALQAVEDPLQAKKRAVKRSRNLLDALEGLQADLLTGQVGEGRLHRIMALVGQAKLDVDPELSALIADIELRARVELAKLGVFADA